MTLIAIMDGVYKLFFTDITIRKSVDKMQTHRPHVGIGRELELYSWPRGVGAAGKYKPLHDHRDGAQPLKLV